MSEKSVKKQALGELNRLLKRWAPKMGLSEWGLTGLISCEDRKNSEGDVYASCCADPVYLNAKVTIYPAWWRLSIKKREAAIVHELAHCISQEAWDALASQGENRYFNPIARAEIIERLTQRIANIAFRAPQ